MNEGNIQGNIERKTSKLRIIKIIIIMVLIIFGLLIFKQEFVKSKEVKITEGTHPQLTIQKEIIKNKTIEDNLKIYPILSLPQTKSQEETNYFLNTLEDINEKIENIKNNQKEELIKNSFKKYVISDRGVNIRNKDMEIITAIPLNSEVTVLKEKYTENGEYDLILYKEKDSEEDTYAYISNKYLGLQKKVAPVNKTVQNKNTSAPNVENSKQGKYLGKFSATAYCNCSKCCGKWAGGPTASGAMPQAGRTIAVDPKVIPLGTKVIINGKTYTAEDTGSAIKGNRIDIYHSSHSSALQWGRRTVDVYLAS